MSLNSESEILKDLQEKMDKTVSVLKEDLNHIRAGRANPLILDRISVNYYGADTPLKQLASISVPEPRMIQIQPYDASIMSDIEKAILVSDLGLNPSNDGKIIRLVIPMLTEERRKELTKEIKKYGEDSKIALRNERRDANEAIKKLNKAKEMTDDEMASAEKEVQKLIDKYNDVIDKMVVSKNEEIMEV